MLRCNDNDNDLATANWKASAIFVGCQNVMMSSAAMLFCPINYFT